MDLDTLSPDEIYSVLLTRLGKEIRKDPEKIASRLERSGENMLRLAKEIRSGQAEQALTKQMDPTGGFRSVSGVADKVAVNVFSPDGSLKHKSGNIN